MGRDFLQKYCSRIDFKENIIEFSHPEDPLPFADSFGDDLDAEVFDNCILSVHADNSFTIPAQSEVVVIGRLSSVPKGVNISTGEIYGLVTPKSDLPHCYSVFGASELVKVSKYVGVCSSNSLATRRGTRNLIYILAFILLILLTTSAYSTSTLLLLFSTNFS